MIYYWKNEKEMFKIAIEINEKKEEQEKNANELPILAIIVEAFSY